MRFPITYFNCVVIVVVINIEVSFALIKHCLTGLDDLYGDRTVDAIPNARGIVRFDVGSDYANSSVLTTMSDNGLKESLEIQTSRVNGTNGFHDVVDIT